MRFTAALLTLAAVTAMAAGACSGSDGGSDSATPPCASGESSPDEFPDIIEAVADEVEPGVWAFSVTVSSPYDTPERYADGWRVLGPDCTVYGIHTLTHDHAGEQPFTRRQSGVAIPDDVDTVTIEGRDQANGFGGGVVTVTLDRS